MELEYITTYTTQRTFDKQINYKIKLEILFVLKLHGYICDIDFSFKK